MAEKILTVEIVRYASGKKKLNLSVNYDKDMAEVAANAIKIIEMFKAAAKPEPVTTPE